MALAIVIIDANVSYFFVLARKVVFLSFFIVVLVLVVFIWILVCCKFLCQLFDDVLFLYNIFEIWVDEHKLVFIGDVEPLVYVRVVGLNSKSYFLFLNQKLWILMF